MNAMNHRRCWGLAGTLIALLFSLTGCQSNQPAGITDLTISDAIQRYRHVEEERLASNPSTTDSEAWTWNSAGDFKSVVSPDGDYYVLPYLTLGMIPQDTQPTRQPGSQPSDQSQAAASQPLAKGRVPEGYWRQDIWHQMGHEALDMGQRGFWRGFKTSFWDVENALLLTAAMGASVAVRETGVDNTVRERTRGHRQLGDLDEPLQLLCHPGTHFAGAGVLWLTTALTKDVEGHEFSRALAEALSVNGVTTMALKAAANTRTPDGEHMGWPSGHTSSVFTVAAVVNEFYGPLAGVPAFALAGLCGYQRLDSRVHDFSDVIFGAMLGYVVGTSVARDEKAQFPEIWGMKVVPYVDPESGATGLALMKSW